MRAGSHFDLNGLQLQAPVLDPRATAPTTPTLTAGRMYYDTAAGAPRFYDGAAWNLKATDSVLLGGQNLAFVLTRSNHTGTQLAATISDFNAAVRINRLDQMAAPTAAVSMGSQQITNLGAPALDSDAATQGYVKSQVQSAAAGIDSKPSVRIAITTNDTLSGLAARDAITPANGDRILATNQTTASQNGVYVAAAGAWSRAVDADQTGEITPGALWYVEEGTANGGSQFRVQNTGAITLDTTSISIVKFSGGQTYTASLGVELIGSDFRAVVQASGGIVREASGLRIDTTIVTRKAVGFIGNGALFNIPFVHNLNTQDIQVTVRDAGTNEMVLVHWVATDVNTVTFTFNTPVAPATNSYRAAVQG